MTASQGTSAPMDRVRALLDTLRARMPHTLAAYHPAKIAQWGIARKIRASLVVCGIGLLVIGLAYWRASAGVERAARIFDAHQSQAALSGRLSEQVAEARRLQTVYAARQGEDDRKALQQAHEQLLATLAQLQQQAAGQSVAVQVADVATKVKAFAEGIASLNQRVDEMGSGDASLRAQLQARADSIDPAVDAAGRPALAASWQKMRRFESQFLLTGDASQTDKVSEQKMPFDLALEAARLPATDTAALRDGMEAYQQALLAYTAARIGLDVEAQALEGTAAEITPALGALSQAQAASLEAARERQQSQRRWMTGLFAVIWLIVAGVVVAVLLLVLKAVRQPIEDTLRFADDIADDRLQTELRIHNPHDEIGQLAHRLRDMQVRLRGRFEAERAAARDNERARQALDSVQTGLLLLDGEGRVGYANRALGQALALPDDLMGAPATRLHPAFGALQRQLEAGDAAHAQEIELGGTRYVLAASPIVVEGQRLGAAVEWRSRALELVVEGEIAALVDGAARGELDGRVPLQDKQGFVRTLSLSINHLLDTFQDKLDAIQHLLAALAQGDLRVRMEGEFAGVFARMRDDANAMVAQLSAIVLDIQSAAGTLNEAAMAIAAGNGDVSAHTQAQAASLRDTAGAMEEITAIVRQNADAAQQADRLVADAVSVAASGGEVVEGVVGTMREIDTASRRIGEIVAVIDGIAFQTNLLALNAAVEAARAGEQGRGFAVVAGEVRNLAQRSADAARQIKTLVGASVERVAEGSAQAHRAGETMGQIMGRIGGVARLMADISGGSRSQAGGIEEINAGIGRMEQTTQRNAALVEEATEAAHAMQAQATALTEAVAVFRVRAGTPAANPRAGGRRTTPALP